jgi:[acyl-carrier-protein] S-malonyltransferase
MGKALADAFPVCRETFDEADAALGEALSTTIFEGPADRLTLTENTQPAILTMSVAAARLLLSRGLAPAFVAGHSLGEYTAAVASGALSVEDGMELVSLRGRLMAEIQSERPGAMAAVIGLEAERLSELCEEAWSAGVVSLANLNTPAQIVVSGEEPAVERLMELAQEAGATRVVRLQVGAAFHSELMKPVQAKLAATMEGLSWRDPDTPLAANASAQLVSSADGIREALIAQIASPVRWVECVQTLVDAGCSRFVELGSGRVLGGLIRQIAPGTATVAVESPAQLAEFVAG